jgi:flagellar hook-associated protein 1 FlgK
VSGTFSSLNTALSALRYQQAALDVSSTNVANASVDGYVRRRVVGETASNESTSAIWSRSREIGSGVASSSVQRVTDALLDSRLRKENATQSYLDQKSGVLNRLETGIAEPGDSGISAALNDFRAALQDLSNSPGTPAARSQVLAKAAVASDAFNLQANNFVAEASDQRAQVVANVKEINDVAMQLASTNKTIVAASGAGGDTTTLLDTRDKLALRLAQLAGAASTVRSDGGMDVTLNGQTLVSGGQASTLEVSSGITSDGSADGSPTTFDAVAPDGSSTAVTGALGGQTGASVELIDQVIPGYIAGLGQVASALADAVNGVQAAGYDADGNTGDPLFSYDPANPAATLSVSITETSKLAAASLPGGAVEGTNAAAMASAVTVDDSYERLVNSFGITVGSVKQLAANQQVMTDQIQASHEQLAGVSIDEETVNLTMAQRSYQAASRVMSTVDEMLDTLINRTGKVGL